MKRPWRPKYTRDCRTDPFYNSISLELVGAYERLLDIAWDEDGLREEWFPGYLADELRVSRRKFVTLWERLRVKFVEISPGIWSNPRLEKERLEADKLAEEARKRAELRWAKHASALRSAHITKQCNSQSQSHTQSQNTEETLAQPPAERERFDFELIYGLYPRKQGKAAGIRACQRKVKTEERYQALQRAVTNFAESRKGQDPQYTPYFSTWINSQWEDWVNGPPAGPSLANSNRSLFAEKWGQAKNG